MVRVGCRGTGGAVVSVKNPEPLAQEKCSTTKATASLALALPNLPAGALPEMACPKSAVE